MAFQWFSRKKKEENIQHTTVQNRYEAVSNEIKTRKEYEYSLQLFRLWYNFVQNCFSSFRAEMNMKPNDIMLISLYSLALYNSIYIFPQRQNDKINDTALDILRCYTWKQLNANHYNNDNETISLQFISEVTKHYVELFKYVEQLQDQEMNDENILMKKHYYVMKQFGQMDAMIPMIMLLEETTFFQKFSGFLNALPSRWKNLPQKTDNIMKRETTQKPAAQQDQYYDGQITYDTSLSSEYNEEVCALMQKTNYPKMQQLFQMLCKAVNMVSQECLEKNDFESYNRIDYDALWGVFLYLYTIYYRPEKKEDFENDNETMMNILMLWNWKNEGNEASVLSKFERIIDNVKGIYNEMSKNDMPNDANHTQGLFMMVVSRSVFKDRNDLGSIRKHYNYCRNAIRLTLRMLNEVNDTSMNN